MRIRITLLSAFAAVALSGAPAQASVCPIVPTTDPDCSSLLPNYWQNPTNPWCPINGCDWLVIY
ncbi:MAG: hypothetical protein HOQ09_07750 [Gemmatimonadaceae bacterium]|nr:hypothetical protein [Gemmatimonadaceae bacterium]